MKAKKMILPIFNFKSIIFYIFIESDRFYSMKRANRNKNGLRVKGLGEPLHPTNTSISLLLIILLIFLLEQMLYKIEAFYKNTKDSKKIIRNSNVKA